MIKQEQAVLDFKNQVKINCNSQSFLIQTTLANEVVDYIQRLENLTAVYETILSKTMLGVNCNDCPFIDGCIYQEGKVEDCQQKMLSRTNNLGESI